MQAQAKELLNFSGPPSAADIVSRADKLADMVASTGADRAMIGGAPYLQGPLQAALESKGVEAVFAFTQQVSVESVGPDGKVTINREFKHAGFVTPPDIAHVSGSPEAGKPDVVVNATRFDSTPAQQRDGMVDLPRELRAEVSALANFTSAPSPQEIADRSSAMAAVIAGAVQTMKAEGLIPENAKVGAMAGGAMWSQASIEQSLRSHDISPAYSFSERVSVDKHMPDGSVQKTAQFEHKSFVEGATQAIASREIDRSMDGQQQSSREAGSGGQPSAARDEASSSRSDSAAQKNESPVSEKSDRAAPESPAASPERER